MMPLTSVSETSTLFPKPTWSIQNGQNLHLILVTRVLTFLQRNNGKQNVVLSEDESDTANRIYSPKLLICVTLPQSSICPVYQSNLTNDFSIEISK